jgi:hypothetical protein
MHELYGKCKEKSEEYIQDNPECKLVRGFYYCPILGKRQHWWTTLPDGTIHDPTIAQFPSPYGEYEEFDGICECEECGKRIKEEDAIFMGRYPTCSGTCAKRLVGL